GPGGGQAPAPVAPACWGATSAWPSGAPPPAPGRMVAEAAPKTLPLHRLPLATMQAVEPRITDEVFSVLSVERSVASRTSFGGTAPRQVRAQAKKWLKLLDKEARQGPP